jgi:hypothetical protein
VGIHAKSDDAIKLNHSREASSAQQSPRRRFDEGQLRLLAALSGQSIFKHFLTEADRAVVSLTSPLEDQAGYALASNYGSISLFPFCLPCRPCIDLKFPAQPPSLPGSFSSLWKKRLGYISHAPSIRDELLQPRKSVDHFRSYRIYYIYPSPCL